MASSDQASCTSVVRDVAVIGFDLAKTTVRFAALDATVKVLTCRLYLKDKLLKVTPAMNPRRFGMEVPSPSARTASRISSTSAVLTSETSRLPM